jgi:hypothetical protein
MGKSKKEIKPGDIVAVAKQEPIILGNYRPMPRFKSGCSTC